MLYDALFQVGLLNMVQVRIVQNFLAALSNFRADISDIKIDERGMVQVGARQILIHCTFCVSSFAVLSIEIIEIFALFRVEIFARQQSPF